MRSQREGILLGTRNDAGQATFGVEISNYSGLGELIQDKYPTTAARGQPGVMPSTIHPRTYRTMLTDDEAIVSVERTGSEDDPSSNEQENLAHLSRWMLATEKWWYRSR